MHRLQVPRLTGIRLELATDVLHVRVDRALVRLERDAVHGVEQLRPGEDPAGLPGERGEQLELGRREVHLTVAGAYAQPRDVEGHIGGADHIG